MKCVKSYIMETARGRYEIAARVDGVYFCREFGFNGYGVGWSKWLKMGRICEISSFSGGAVSVLFENCLFGSRSAIVEFKRKRINPNYRLPN